MNQDDDNLWLAAALDGELGVDSSVDFQSRLARDPALQAEWARQRALRTAIREGATYHDLPAPLRERIAETIGTRKETDSAPGSLARQTSMSPARAGRRRWTLAAASAALGAMLGAGLTWRMVEHRPALRDDGERIAEDAVAGHIRATLTDRPIDVASSDQHTVKPWLAERLSYSPPVPDLSAHGFELTGARRDVIDGQMVGVLVYRRRQHTISAFLRPTGAAGRGPQPLHRAVRGFNVVALTRGTIDYWVVSDLNARELGDFVDLLVAGG